VVNLTSRTTITRVAIVQMVTAAGDPSTYAPRLSLVYLMHSGRLALCSALHFPLFAKNPNAYFSPNCQRFLPRRSLPLLPSASSRTRLFSPLPFFLL
jgi:hypothetical protein